LSAAAGPAEAAPPLSVWRSSLLQAAPCHHGFTGRHGGVSVGPFASLNLASHLGDVPEHVQTNRQRVLRALHCQAAAWIGVRQVHGTDIVEVTHNAGKNIVADALWSRDPQVALSVATADCQPILIADRRGRCVAAVHAGWRGTAAGLPALMVQRLVHNGIAAADLLVSLGPCIGPCCFEVEADTAAALQQVSTHVPQAVQPRGERFVADLWAINASQIEQAGVPAAQLDSVRTCSRCTPGLFSHRRATACGSPTGRQAGVIALCA
jgi:YfiH family protein